MFSWIKKGKYTSKFCKGFQIRVITIGSHKSKSKDKGDLLMDKGEPRPFGVAPGEITAAKPEGTVETTFFTRVGTKSAVVTAHYKHLEIGEEISGVGSKHLSIVSDKPVGGSAPPPQAPPKLPKPKVTFATEEVIYDVPSVRSLYKNVNGEY